MGKKFPVILFLYLLGESLLSPVSSSSLLIHGQGEKEKSLAAQKHCDKEMWSKLSSKPLASLQMSELNMHRKNIISWGLAKSGILKSLILYNSWWILEIYM